MGTFAVNGGAFARPASTVVVDAFGLRFVDRMSEYVLSVEHALRRGSMEMR